MKKTFCDLCGKEFKWYNDYFYFGKMNNNYEVCSYCSEEIWKFIKSLRKREKK